VKRILVLFSNEWDRSELAAERYAGRYEFLYHGESLFRFPGILKLLYFDALQFVDEVVARFERERLDGVLSTDDYVGALIAALVARRLGLPGGAPERIALAQHKFLARRRQREVAASETPDFALVPVAVRGAPPRLAFPFFLKPVKGTYSVLAGRVDTPRAFERRTAFGPLEKFCLRAAVRPFNQLLRACADFELDASYFLAEQLLEGQQVTVDGFAFWDRVETLGVVDSVMFPGTSTFERFEYPSSLPAPVQARMEELTRRLARGMGMRNCQFNVELIYDPRRDEIKIVEINPRMSCQFADLYEKVDGRSTYDILLDLTLGRRPSFQRRQGEYRCAASFVFRTFRGARVTKVPTRSQLERFRQQHSGARIKVYGRAGQSLLVEMKAVGSYRYAVVNAGAGTRSDLFATYRQAVEHLEFAFA
jgi:hypothetical protein